MEKKKNSGKAYKPRPPFRTLEGIESAAWDKLSRDAVFAITEFYKKFNGYNRYDLSLTYKEVRKKMSNRPFSRSIWELIGYGFIDVRRFGRLERNCSIYGLSNRWRHLSEKPEVLNQIEKLLKEIERLKRERASRKKRMNIREFQNKILKLGQRG